MNHLIHLGYQILDRNVRTPYGELDIVAQMGEVVVFCEVKARTSLAFGYPETSVNARKMKHLIDSAQYYVQNHPELSGSWRMDLIAIRRLVGRDPEVEIFENVSA